MSSSPLGFIVLVGFGIWIASRSEQNPRPASTIYINTSLIWVVLIKFLLSFLFFIPFMVSDSRFMAVVAMILSAVVCFPGLIIDLIIIPLGAYRIAYWIAVTFRPLNFLKGKYAGGVFYGALALARQKYSVADVDWLSMRFDLGTTALEKQKEIAMALLAVLNHDRLTARVLFQFIDESGASYGSRRIRRIARDWLVADAARHGDWDKVIFIGERGMASQRWSYAVARIGERLIRRPTALNNWQLWLLWLLAPRRKMLKPLLMRALSTTRSTRSRSYTQTLTKKLPEVLTKLNDIFFVISTEHASNATQARFLNIINSIDYILETTDLNAHISQRVQTINTTPNVSAEMIVLMLKEHLVELIMPAIKQFPQLAQNISDASFLSRPIEKMRHGLFEDIEVRSNDYKNRTFTQTHITLFSEWQTWAQFREVADRIMLISPSSQDALFKIIFPPVCNFSVFQYDILKRNTLAHEMCTWLFQYSSGHPTDAELLAGNMAAFES
jgi:hypothetical protein